jgi:hypothetical protein
MKCITITIHKLFVQVFWYSSFRDGWKLIKLDGWNIVTKVDVAKS